jgi:hypothetical protein
VVNTLLTATTAGIGVAVAVHGVCRHARDLALPVTDPRKGAALVRAFRSVIGGLALATAALAWRWDIDWLLLLALAVGTEELLETSTVVAAIREGERRRTQPAAAASVTSPRVRRYSL